MSDSSLLINPLPTGWENYQFGDVCGRVKDSYKPIEGGETPYVGLEHLMKGFPAFVGRGTESDIKCRLLKPAIFCLESFVHISAKEHK